jgi:hypothetical protein
MADHYRWYPSTEDSVVPWNARYSFPSQANKTTKITPRIPPKNGAEFSPGNFIRLEFPAQGYVNPANTTISFDVGLINAGTPTAGSGFRFQNNIQSIFRRVRLMYGSTPIEDIIDYNQIVRNLTEWAGPNQAGIDGFSVAEGIGGVTAGSGFKVVTGPTYSTVPYPLINVRQNLIQGIDNTTGSTIKYVPALDDSVSPYRTWRRYQVALNLGLFQQEKLIPTKWMASQLAIEIELEQPAYCIFDTSSLATTSAASATYKVKNVNLIPEILEFDASYDAAFLEGLRNGGVPIAFSTWHTFTYATGNGANINLSVQERSRSVKALFAVQRKPPVMTLDSGATLASSAGQISSYQWRIGGRYFPASPVQCSVDGVPQGAESYTELQKALRTRGDYRLSPPVDIRRWVTMFHSASSPGDAVRHSAGADVDYGCSEGAPSTDDDGHVGYNELTEPPSGQAGALGSACFTAAISLESSNGMHISGLNAEEQSDISFNALYTAAQTAENTISIYSYFDAMLILRENNVIELIQ